MSGAAAASAAAAAARRRREQEEEEMTTYGSGDLNQDWEFKIVRANTPVFRRRKHLERLLAREAQAGWVMVEKFDNLRIRFKRPREARMNDVNLPPGVDPYRVHYGLPPTAFALVLMLTIFACIGVVILAVVLAVPPGVR
jgi:hypothetical protein